LEEDRIRRLDRSAVSPSVQQVYRQATIIALVGNAFLLAIKAIAAHLSGSSALYADAANSAADLAYSVLMLIGLWLSLRPPDLSHPHGHQRIEPLVSVGIGAAMGYAGYEALTNGLAAWQQSAPVDVSLWFIAVPLVTVIAKGGMYLRVRSLASRVTSPAIAASARDHIADILTAGVVLIGLIGHRLFLPQADPIAGILVSVWIFYQALSVIREAIGHLIGAGASPELHAAAIEAIRQVPDVVDIEQLILEHVGPELRADIHVVVDGNMPLRRVHRVSHAIREAVEALDGVDHAFVHVEPAD
jgi:cation diffusion facilitator family transporter